jgi:hypothetical protein
MDCFASLAMTAEGLHHTLTRHRPPPGRREAPPDDRLRRAIQYSKGADDKSRSRGLLDRPVKPDDDSSPGLLERVNDSATNAQSKPRRWVTAYDQMP